jgi:hypothetical protein
LIFRQISMLLICAAAFAFVVALAHIPYARGAVTSEAGSVWFPFPKNPSSGPMDILLGKVTSVKRTTGRNGLEVTYTESVLGDYRGWYKQGEVVYIRGNRDQSLARTGPPEMSIPDVAVGKLWLTAASRGRGQILYYEFALLPIGVFVPISVPASHQRAALAALRLMSERLANGFKHVPTDAVTGRHLFRGNGYCKWALGCSVMHAGHDNAPLRKELAKKAFILRHPSRAAWLIYLLATHRGEVVFPNSLAHFSPSGIPQAASSLQGMRRFQLVTQAILRDLLAASPYLRRGNPANGKLSRRWGQRRSALPTAITESPSLAAYVCIAAFVGAATATLVYCIAKIGGFPGRGRR